MLFLNENTIIYFVLLYMHSVLNTGTKTYTWLRGLGGLEYKMTKENKINKIIFT